MGTVETYQIVPTDFRLLLAQEMAARTMSTLDGLLLPDRFQEAYQRLVELFIAHARESAQRNTPRDPWNPQ